MSYRFKYFIDFQIIWIWINFQKNGLIELLDSSLIIIVFWWLNQWVFYWELYLSNRSIFYWWVIWGQTFTIYERIWDSKQNRMKHIQISTYMPKIREGIPRNFFLTLQWSYKLEILWFLRTCKQLTRSVFSSHFVWKWN